MSILRVHKKASTERDVKVLLKASKRIKDPFGFRVHHVANEDFYTDQESAVQTLSDLFNQSVEEATGMTLKAGIDFKAHIRMQKEFIERTARRDYQGAFLKEMGLHLGMSDGQGVDVFARFIVGIEEDATLKGMMGEYVKEQLDTPLHREQMKYFVTWHENAHLTGCLEPQADMIGALMCRQAFDDTTMLEIFSDTRMIHNLFLNEELLEVYGWQTTEAFDYALGLDQETVDSLSEDNMFEIALTDFDTHNKAAALALYALLEVYEKNFGNVADGVSIKKMEPICEKLLSLDVFDQDSLETAFLQRLHFALKRSANPDLYFDAEFAATKPKPVHTFKSDVPEFLPDPSLISPS